MLLYSKSMIQSELDKEVVDHQISTSCIYQISFQDATMMVTAIYSGTDKEMTVLSGNKRHLF